MKEPWGRKIRLICLTVLLASILSVGMIAGYFPSSDSIPLEVKEPLEISSYPMAFSLFPGETTDFNVTIQNLASVNYTVTLDFSLNDTAYQTQYVTFSSETYTVTPGEQNLAAWLKVAPEAPTGNFLLTITALRQGQKTPTPQQSPEPTPEPSSESPTETYLRPLLELLGSGARWAARNGTSALFISWLDTYEAHHLTDGAQWGPWSEEEDMSKWRQDILEALELKGFNTQTAGDIPQNLSNYDLVLIQAYWAVEPKHVTLLKDYIANGGSVVIIAGVPCYLNVECKDWWPGGSMLPDWLGGGYYANAGGTIVATVDNPFGTPFLTGETLLYANSSSCAAVSSPTNNGQIIAGWNPGYYTFTDDFEQEYINDYNQGLAFAFTHEYGQGRVYYQAAW
jgi:hypothetical protein